MFFCIYLLVMRKYWGKQFQSQEFPRSGRKAEGVEEKKKKKVGENNGQLRFVRQHGRRTQVRLDQDLRVVECLTTWLFQTWILNWFQTMLFVDILTPPNGAPQQEEKMPEIPWSGSKAKTEKKERPKVMAHAKPPGPMYQNQRKICQLPLRMLIFGMQPYFEYFFIAPSPPSKPLKV